MVRGFFQLTASICAVYYTVQRGLFITVGPFDLTVPLDMIELCREL
jgi:hypothetical protein